jgi:hypothetical protein
MTTTDNTNSTDAGSGCRTALQIFAEQKFVDWRGLPTGCSLTEMTAMFPLLNQGVGSGHLGRRHRQVEFRMLQVNGYQQPVRAWFDSMRLAMLDAEHPGLVEEQSAALLVSLGEPEAKFDFYWDVVEIKEGELVYSSRGMSLFTDPTDHQLLRLLVFPVMTVEEYVQNFRLEFRMREF